MAEVKPRSFDLKSWQGLTDVLKAARESRMEPTAYAEFRNLVLSYAQLKGSDVELRKTIETIISTFTVPRSESDLNDTRGAAEHAHLGRRVVPSFTVVPPKQVTLKVVSYAEKKIPEIQPVKEEIPVLVQKEVEIPKAEEVVTPTETPAAEIPAKEEPLPIPKPPISTVAPVPLKSVDEHRVRVTDIKRQVNRLVGNPIMLVDHGNQIGREYMRALLAALKATSPGSTLDVEASMVALENSFAKIVEVSSRPKDAVAEETNTVSDTPMVPPIPEQAEPVVSVMEEAPVPEPVAVPHVEVVSTETPAEDRVSPEPLPEEAPVPLPGEVITPIPEPVDEEPVALPSMSEEPEVAEVAVQPEVPHLPVPEEVVETPVLNEVEDDSVPSDMGVVLPDEVPAIVSEPVAELSDRWSDLSRGELELPAEDVSLTPAPATPVSDVLVEDIPAREEIVERAPADRGTSSADMQAQIKALREELRAREVEMQQPAPEQERTSRPVIPSIIDIEEAPIPQRVEVIPEAPQAPVQDELSTQSLAHRSIGAMTGITMTTPQADLMMPEVTSVLGQLLHEWNIFASSGLFGMGPGGLEHPLYEKLAKLPMGEVLSGRFENADMKIVHVIKEYVNAWRHEQGIAYNPTETFEHYLRRVSQRILKRQNAANVV